jgi:nucleotidyltransferase substrate binding protein (TIGR01987 family)
MIDYSKLKDSLKHLELQFDNYQTLDVKLPSLMQEAVMESVIQRFEVCFDTLWKTLKRYLREVLGLAELPSSPKPLLRIANENKLLGGKVEDWLSYADARTNTSHDYNHEKAKETLECVRVFIRDAVRLYQTMTGDSWA